jgi:hypothetical protein
MQAEASVQIDLEEYDRVQLILNTARADFDRSAYFKLTKIELNSESMTMSIEGLN